ncbi:GIY-YIG nuclease family protein [soil metagenome]
MKQPASNSWFVYILHCADGTLYTGITKDVTRRCQQHNAGTASRYTRSRLPTKLLWHEPQADQSSALKREAAIKSMTRSEKLQLIGLSKKSA